MAKSPENGEPGGPGGPGGPLIDSPCRFRTNLNRGRGAQSAFISQLLLLSLLQFGDEPRRVTNEEGVVKRLALMVHLISARTHNRRSVRRTDS